MRKQWFAVTMLAVGLSVVACGDSAAPLQLENIEDVEYHPSLGVNLSAMTVTQSGVYYLDEVVGTGALAESGAEVTVEYQLRYRSGQVGDPGNAPFTFTMDDLGTAIEGFHEGIRGMRVGGQRKFLVPPLLGYGTRGPTGILIFDVEVTSVVAP
jgi:FKBP-type peptidyl-prolyl cis-trans isomerase